MKKPFIIGVNGSPHADGIVVELLDLALEGAKEFDAEVKRLDLYSLNIKPTPGNFSRDPATEVVAAMPDDDMKALYADIARADGLVFATPVYWMNMSAVMKNFIERLTPLEVEMEGKLAAFISASKENHGGGESAAMAMATALLQMGCMVPPNGVIWHPAGTWHEDWPRIDATRVGKTMVNIIKLLPPNNDWIEGENTV